MKPLYAVPIKTTSSVLTLLAAVFFIALYGLMFYVESTQKQIIIQCSASQQAVVVPPLKEVASGWGGESIVKPYQVTSARCDQLKNRQHHLSLLFQITTGVALLFCLFVHRYASLNIVKPVRELHQQAIYISRGNYNVRNALEVKNELGVLGKTFNRMCDAIEKNIVNLEDQAVRDALTGLLNRRYLDEYLPRLLKRIQGTSRTVSVAMIDIDNFKQLNDQFGHDAGDFVLKTIGKLLRDRVRSADMVCRVGGEEFVIILMNTDLVLTCQRLANITQTVKHTQMMFQEKALPIVTLSIGVAIAPMNGHDAHELLSAADQALYQAKKQGKDRVEVFNENRQDTKV